jgi:hypothetical protein
MPVQLVQPSTAIMCQIVRCSITAIILRSDRGDWS